MRGASPGLKKADHYPTQEKTISERNDHMQIAVDQLRPWQKLSIDLRIHAAGQPQQDLLIAMYDQFDRLGGALGLPPRREDERHRWVKSVFRHRVNVAVFSQAQGAVGHCFLAADTPGSQRWRSLCIKPFAGGVLGRPS